ncbi:MAG: hypothetical protein CMJ19_05025 [Phycisphaeraceae bacterium]|nr:hypothetical protein [Phycisphaeraceae bacterium]
MTSVYLHWHAARLRIKTASGSSVREFDRDGASGGSNKKTAATHKGMTTACKPATGERIANRQKGCILRELM